MSDGLRESEESNGALRRPAEQSPAGPIRLLLLLLIFFLGASPSRLSLGPGSRFALTWGPSVVAAQTPADSLRWRHAMAMAVAGFLHNEAPRGGLVLQSSDSTDSRDWSVGFIIEVTHLLDSLRLRTPGDSAVGGKVTFSGLQNFEQPYGGIPRQLLQLQLTETTCIGAPGSGHYLSGTVYAVRLFTRGISLYADINYLETPEGVCE